MPAEPRRDADASLRFCYCAGEPRLDGPTDRRIGRVRHYAPGHCADSPCARGPHTVLEVWKWRDGPRGSPDRLPAVTSSPGPNLVSSLVSNSPDMSRGSPSSARQHDATYTRMSGKGANFDPMIPFVLDSPAAQHGDDCLDVFGCDWRLLRLSPRSMAVAAIASSPVHTRRVRRRPACGTRATGSGYARARRCRQGMDVRTLPRSDVRAYAMCRCI
jgi:hypothetical protein